MNGTFNGFSVNGAARSSWVVRAAVFATAVAVAAISPTRIVHATAHGNAAALVSLSPARIISARSTGTASASYSVEPWLSCSAASSATATTTGRAAVRRDVFASAGGDATCTGCALTAQAIGNAQGAAGASVNLVRAHIIHPGRSTTSCVAASSAESDVTRYVSAFQRCGSVSGWGEASVRRSGNSTFSHDGYSRASGAASGRVDQDKTRVITTLGAFDFAASNAEAVGFIVYSARALGSAASLSLPSASTHIYRPKAAATAMASAHVDATRIVLPKAAGEGKALYRISSPRLRHAASVTGGMGAHVVQAVGVRTAMVRQSAATAGAWLVLAKFGEQHRGASEGILAECTRVKADAHAIFCAQASSPLALAVTLSSEACLIRMGRVDAALATALLGRAYAVANSEIHAPDERAMRVSGEDRRMRVSATERTMRVAA